MSFLSSVQNRVSSAVQTYRQYAPTIDRVKSGVKTAVSAFNSGKSAFESARNVAQRGYTAASTAIREGRQMSIFNGGRPPSAFSRLTGPLGVVGNVAKTIKGVGTSINDIRTAIRTGSAHDISTAAQSTLGTVRSGLSTVQSGFQAWGARQAHNAYTAATAAFRSAAPGAATNVAEAAARSATRSSFLHATGSTFEAATRQVARAGAREAAEAAARAGGTLAHAVAGSGSRAAARAAISAGSNAAVHAAAEVGARAAASTVGRAAARFAPGVNVAMAAIDTGVAVATLADPNASTGKKITSVITAAGSIAAATNIPVVSQIGAGVSAVSSFVSAFF